MAAQSHDLVLNLKDIANPHGGGNFKPDIKASAKGLLNILSDRYFFLLLHYLADLLDVLGRFSQRFQLRYGILIEQADNLSELLQSLRVCGSNGGPNLAKALTYTKCGDEKCETLKRYEEAHDVKYMDVTLVKPQERKGKRTHFPKLSGIQFEMASALIDEIKSYLPNRDMQIFSVLDPNNWPDVDTDSQYSEIHFYGLPEIAELYRSYNIERDNINMDSGKFTNLWRDTLITIMNSADFCKYKGKVITFWKHFLDLPNMVHPVVGDLVTKVLATPIGSADAERSFSILFHIRNKRRSRLTTEHLEDNMRVRMNAPNDLDEFGPYALKVAKKWAEKNFLTDDPVRIQTGPKRPTNREINPGGDGDVPDNNNNNYKYLDGSNLF